jgi:hypothetical protein
MVHADAVAMEIIVDGEIELAVQFHSEQNQTKQPTNPRPWLYIGRVVIRYDIIIESHIVDIDYFSLFRTTFSFK